MRRCRGGRSREGRFGENAKKIAKKPVANEHGLAGT